MNYLEDITPIKNLKMLDNPFSGPLIPVKTNPGIVMKSDASNLQWRLISSGVTGVEVNLLFEKTKILFNRTYYNENNSVITYKIYPGG
ncbi:hypothetical protein D3H55_09740 [Bacillus salacetis]|uniref:Uncharacterized protein n=1 Tax=Bacillus salacetis TaxID=2315464 RepID=A0A3A1QZ09_9BACI|nr:hypothetical protein [Bacillus salacetis]RIW34256.1 hypothetical protein D3H55_09740 [Bacillus salacetis]